MFYRITWEEALETLTGPRFFALAVRTPAYQGVMAARVAAQVDEVESAPGSAPGPEMGPQDRETKVLPGSQGVLAASDIGDLFEMGKG